MHIGDGGCTSLPVVCADNGCGVGQQQQGPGAMGAKAPLGSGLPAWSDPQSEPCAACHVCRYTFEPPSIFCTSCSQRIKRNQVRCSTQLHSVSQSVSFTFSSHLGLITCLSLIHRGSTQHDMEVSTEKPGDSCFSHFPTPRSMLSSLWCVSACLGPFCGLTCWMLSSV